MRVGVGIVHAARGMVYHSNCCRSCYRVCAGCMGGIAYAICTVHTVGADGVWGCGIQPARGADPYSINGEGATYLARFVDGVVMQQHLQLVLQPLHGAAMC